MSESLHVAGNVDAAEVARFQSVASRWWDPEGEMRPLHDLNPVRLAYVELCGPLAGRAVVDVRCGGGLLSEAMARKGARVVGLDMADELLRVAQLQVYSPKMGFISKDPGEVATSYNSQEVVFVVYRILLVMGKISINWSGE